MKKHVLSIGSVSIDIKAFSPVYNETESYRDGTIDLVPGGVARGMAMNLQRLGLSSSILSVVGKDIFGDYLRRDLAGAGVCVSLLRTSEKRRTSLFSVMAMGSRPASCVYCNDVLQEIRFDSDVRSFIEAEQVTAAAIDSNLPEQTLKDIYAYAECVRKSGREFFVFQNATAPDIAHKSLPYAGLVDLFGCNEFEAAALLEYAGLVPAGTELIPDAELARLFAKLGYGNFIITFGARGVLVYCGGGTYIEKPYTPSEIVDTIGAGDAFASGFLYGFMDGTPVRRCIHYGLCCARETLQTRETVSALLSADWLERTEA